MVQKEARIEEFEDNFAVMLQQSVRWRVTLFTRICLKVFCCTVLTLVAGSGLHSGTRAAALSAVSMRRCRGSSPVAVAAKQADAAAAAQRSGVLAFVTLLLTHCSLQRLRFSSRMTQVDAQAVALQLTELEDEHVRLQRESSASLATCQGQLASVTRQLQDSQDVGRTTWQSFSAAQEQLRQAQSALAAADARVQSLTLQVTQLEEQLQQEVQKGSMLLGQTSALDQQLRDALDNARSSSQAAARAIETQSASHMLAQAQQRDAVLEANARTGQLAAQLGACEQRLQMATARAAAAEARLDETTMEVAQQLQAQERALEAVSAAHRRQFEAAIAAVEHRCDLLSRALEESEANARASETRAVAAELAAEEAEEAKKEHERGLRTVSESWEEQR